MPKKEIEITNPHDKLMKQVLSDPIVARDFITHHLPESIAEKINLDKLVPINKSFIDNSNNQKFSDLILKTTFHNTPGYITFFIEHQSTNDDLMPIRYLEYNCQLMREHLKTNKKKKLPIIVNICLYNGKSAFTGPTSLYPMFENPELARKLMFKDFHLVDLSSMEEKELAKNGTASLLELVMKQGIYRDFINWLKENKPLLRELFQNLCSNVPYKKAILRYIYILESESEEKLLNLLEEVTSDKDLVMTVGQRLINRGMQQGMQKGREEGMQKGREEGMQKGREEGMQKGREEGMQKGREEGMQKGILATAKKMLKKGLDISFIKECTGLSEEKIRTIN